MSSLLVAGAGYTGSVLAEEQAASGDYDHVFSLRRSPTAGPGVQPIAVDIGAAEDVLDTALHTLCSCSPLAVAYLLAPDKGDVDGYRRTYVEGQRALAQSLSRLGVEVSHWLFASSTGVYGKVRGWIDEATPLEPSREQAELLHTAEREAWSIGRRFGAEVAAVRFGGIYGPGRDRTIRTVAAGRGLVHPEDGPRYGNRIHRDDVAGVMGWLLRQPSLESVYLAVDDDPADQRDVEQWLADRLGVVELAPPNSPARRGGDKRCRNRRLKATGYTFRFPSFREGYGALIDAGSGR